MIIDSAQLAAFAAVVREGSFRRCRRGAACDALRRIATHQKQLEERVGPGTDCRRNAFACPPEAGQALLRYAQQGGVAPQRGRGPADAGPGPGRRAVHIAVGVNADSLATWFVAAMADAVRAAPMTFDVHVEDQDPRPICCAKAA